jgi:hypothetical protein
MAAIIHDNRMLAERALYCCIDKNNITKQNLYEVKQHEVSIL